MSRTERKWSVRAYRDGDEEGILELWKVVYPKPTYHREEWMRWWNWMYKANPNGIGVIFVADHDGKIVGHAAEIPMAMKIGSESLLVGLGADALTHPDYRRQGMYVELVKARRAEGERRGIRATYSFPNELSYPAMLTRGLTFDIATMQKVVRPLNWQRSVRTQTQNRILLTIGPLAGSLLSAVLFRPRKAPDLKGLTITQVSGFDERFDELCRRVSDRYQVIVLRKKEYLNWRYVAVPDKSYSIYAAQRSEAAVGYLVLSRDRIDQAKTGTVVDVFAESEEVTQCLISEAVESCKQEKIDLIYSARMAGTSLARAFRRNGFLPVPFAKGIRLTGLSNEPTIAGQLLNPNNWFLQIGDSDHG